jgi:hypothetical protein
MVTTQYVYQQSIVQENGVSPGERLPDGVILKSKGDFVLYRGMPEISPGTFGSILSVTNIWESGDISYLPDDYILELRPGETAKVMNLETVEGRPVYNIKVETMGPLYEEGTYKGYQSEEPTPTSGSAAPVKRGPVLTFLVGRFPLLQKLLAGR